MAKVPPILGLASKLKGLIDEEHANPQALREILPDLGCVVRVPRDKELRRTAIGGRDELDIGHIETQLPSQVLAPVAGKPAGYPNAPVLSTLRFLEPSANEGPREVPGVLPQYRTIEHNRVFGKQRIQEINSVEAEAAHGRCGLQHPGVNHPLQSDHVL
jgi:hypothetical protein